MEIRGLFRKGLEELGYIPEDDLLNAFIIYLSELKKWNKAYNLTGLKKDEDIIIKNFLDSLLYLNAMPYGEIKVADIGSGAGFPGIPIKIIRPGIEMYLIEPSGKKAAFLRHIIKFLQLRNIEVIEERVENIKESFLVDVAVTRALFTIEDFIKKGSHIVKQGGILIHSKGPKVKEELQRIKDVKYGIMPCNLPLTKITRYIVAVSL
ncbi:MAG: 16S rRNA (guanine(527)-N(7))-methyltransferase RsmG [Thermodesulfovibrio sp. RBG_19FT_COMBO_42_12]|nr:MAG: 16S rRNA (guanine(527)-N(7))-methyltransferase RsmG [Thermodesulfovibrio sp. RBG_19FT_COMBO_42_12]